MSKERQAFFAVWDRYKEITVEPMTQLGLAKPYDFFLFVRRVFRAAKAKNNALIEKELGQSFTHHQVLEAECRRILLGLGASSPVYEEMVNDILGIKKRKKKGEESDE
jgi:hypothetical protein